MNNNNYYYYYYSYPCMQTQQAGLVTVTVQFTLAAFSLIYLHLSDMSTLLPQINNKQPVMQTELFLKTETRTFVSRPRWLSRHLETKTSVSTTPASRQPTVRKDNSVIIRTRAAWQTQHAGLVTVTVGCGCGDGSATPV